MLSVKTMNYKFQKQNFLCWFWRLLTYCFTTYTLYASTPKVSASSSSSPNLSREPNGMPKGVEGGERRTRVQRPSLPRAPQKTTDCASLWSAQAELLSQSKEKSRQDVSPTCVLRITAWPQVSLAWIVSVGMVESVTVESAASAIGEAIWVKAGGASDLAKSLLGPCSLPVDHTLVSESISNLHSHLIWSLQYLHRQLWEGTCLGKCEFPPKPIPSSVLPSLELTTFQSIHTCSDLWVVGLDRPDF